MRVEFRSIDPVEPQTPSILFLFSLAPLTAQEDGALVETRVRQALFVAVDGVYNSELMAPYDVLQHTVFRDPRDYIETAIVSPDGNAVKTFEGITLGAHYSFANAPEGLVWPWNLDLVPRLILERR